VYRRDEASLPGSRREVGYSREEGVNFLFHRQPLALLGEHGKVRGVRLIHTEVGIDTHGRARLQHIEGSETELRADVVLQAFGFRPSPPAWCAEYGIALDASGRILAGGHAQLPFQTGHPKIFAGGDNMRGADLVVRAVHDGREAAASIAQMLGELPLEAVACVA
jgi:glutamate synthase (NADPH/NADH) small chain